MAKLALTDYFSIPTGAKYFTMKDDRAYYSLLGALSFGFKTQALSVGDNLFKDLSASVLGRPWLAAGADPLPTLTDAPEAYDSRISTDLPADIPQTFTFMLFMSANDGTGDVVACCPAQLFDQFSPAIPVRY